MPTKEEIRAAMTDDMRQFADAMREMLDAKLTHLKTPTLELGAPSERGCTEFQIPKVRTSHRGMSNKKHVEVV